jgi:hypothetical protein
MLNNHVLRPNAAFVVPNELGGTDAGMYLRGRVIVSGLQICVWVHRMLNLVPTPLPIITVSELSLT